MMGLFKSVTTVHASALQQCRHMGVELYTCVGVPDHYPPYRVHVHVSLIFHMLRWKQN